MKKILGLQAPMELASLSLLFFEWGPFFISASRVFLPNSDSNTYDVTKTSFLLMSLSKEGHVVAFFDPNRRRSDFKLENRSELVAVDVSFIGMTYFVVEEKWVRGVMTMSWWWGADHYWRD